MNGRKRHWRVEGCQVELPEGGGVVEAVKGVFRERGFVSKSPIMRPTTSGVLRSYGVKDGGGRVTACEKS